MAKHKTKSFNLSGANVAIIMDGNGRWAKKNTLNVTSGHEKGVDVVRRIVESAAQHKIASLSLYAFSTENWSRPKKEILGIKKLIISAINAQVPDLINQKVALKFFGDYQGFGPEVLYPMQRPSISQCLGRGRLGQHCSLQALFRVRIDLMCIACDL